MAAKRTLMMVDTQPNNNNNNVEDYVVQNLEIVLISSASMHNSLLYIVNASSSPTQNDDVSYKDFLNYYLKFTPSATLLFLFTCRRSQIIIIIYNYCVEIVE